MERKTRTCAVCRKQYKYCNQCKEDVMKPTWHFTFCSENCHDLYGVLSGFESGYISEVDAKNELDKLDLSGKENFGESYKDTLSKIFVVKHAKKNKKKEDVCSTIDVVPSVREENSIIEGIEETVSFDVNGDLL